MPTGLAWAPDGTHMLVVIDGWDRLGVLDPATNTITAQTPVGVAPRDVVVVGDHAFVSNEGGRKPASGDFTNLSYDSPVVADKVDGRASTGTVSEVDLAAGKVVQTYKVGLDPSSLLAHGNEVLVTNSSDDTVSVIDTAKKKVTQPMFGAFSDKPDYTPYTAVPNNIPLDTMNGTAAQATNPMQKTWLAWSEKQNFKSEDQLAFAPFNRLTWYATTGWKRPYPGDSKVMTPDEVLKKFPQTVATNGVDNDIPSSRAQAPHKANG